MSRLVIKGGRQLNGAVGISGAKNAALPIIAATLLAEGEYNIGNIPKLIDISTMAMLMRRLNVGVECDKGSKFDGVQGIDSACGCCGADLRFINNGGDIFEAPYEFVNTMRASILVLGPLIARRKKAKVSLPGGCAIGGRPVDLHLAALEKMGAKIRTHHGDIYAECERLKGTEINFRTVTVTGTENVMMAAVLAEGTTVLNNAAQEPEVVDLARFLTAMGADIKGAGTSCITVDGVPELKPANHSVMPDRIEAGTFLCAVAAAGGKVELHNAPVNEMKAVIDVLRHAGVLIESDGNVIRVESHGRLKAVDVTTQPYPGFPTDMQAQFMAVMAKAQGSSVIDETIFENRFMHVAELQRMGADITVHSSRALVRGVEELSGTQVKSSDLRASAGLVIAGLSAENTSVVLKVEEHLDRGYEGFEIKLAKLGADIKRVTGSE